jgi:hypothetical protein
MGHVVPGVCPSRHEGVGAPGRADEVDDWDVINMPWSRLELATVWQDYLHGKLDSIGGGIRGTYRTTRLL